MNIKGHFNYKKAKPLGHRWSACSTECAEMFIVSLLCFIRYLKFASTATKQGHVHDFESSALLCFFSPKSNWTATLTWCGPKWYLQQLNKLGRKYGSGCQFAPETVFTPKPDRWGQRSQRVEHASISILVHIPDIWWGAYIFLPETQPSMAFCVKQQNFKFYSPTYQGFCFLLFLQMYDCWWGKHTQTWLRKSIFQPSRWICHLSAALPLA